MEWSEFFATYGAALAWLSIAILAAIVEGLTCDLVSIWFVPGALSAMLLSFFLDWIWLQIAVLSAIMLGIAVVLQLGIIPCSGATSVTMMESRACTTA